MNQIMYPKIRQPMMKNPKKTYLINKNMRDNKGRYLPLMAVEFQEGFIENWRRKPPIFRGWRNSAK